MLSKGDSVGGQQYTLEEMQALVDEAHQHDRKVAAHAHGAEGIKTAIIAGVDSIEHSSLIDDEAIQAATVHAAELIGWPNDVGAIEAGRFADIIAVAGNPLDDVALLEDVRFVMKGGKVYKN